MSGNNEKRKIQPVKDRDDKQRTYQKHTAQYKKAINNGFYFEAILIDYACLEDRLRYMLYYLGVLSEENSLSVKGNSQRVKEFRSILREYEGEKATISIQSIGGKQKIVKSIFNFASKSVPTDHEGQIRKLLRNALNDEERIAEIMSILDKIDTWRDYRNEIVHALLNKNLESLNEQVREQAEAGYKLFRRLDSQVRWVKQKKLRGKMKLKL